MRPTDETYFETLETGLDDAFEVAEAARERGEDPTPNVEIPVAKDMADRVENILGIDGVAERVRDLDGEMSREEAALELVADFVDGRVGDYDTDAGKIEGAVRTAVALLTEGVVAAPIEGIDRVEVNDNDDGTQYVAVYYAGPIRSAGGTAQALSVLVADYARAMLGIDAFKPRDDEIERYAEEVDLYDSETGLQYSPKDAETTFITEHCPVMLDGEATGNEEVDGFRDLERIDTNSPRGGMCLVLAEGIALKAPKIQRYTRNLDEVAWPWLQDLIDGTIGADDADEDASDAGSDSDASDDGDAPSASTDAEEPPRADPSDKFLRDLIAGRPVFGHPSKNGGFRLRYGRARNHGNATAGVHPATMHLLDDFLATGTQIKTERPGKAAGIVPVDSIEGPTVKLANGDVRHINDPADALDVRNGVAEILDVGEYLVNYGEFVENNHELAPASYAPEWWIQDLDAAGADVQALRDSPYVDLTAPTADQALAWATDYDAPLHPAYTYLWHDIDVEQFRALADAVADAHTDASDDDDRGVLVLDHTTTVRETLEALLITHHQGDDTIRVDDWLPLARSLGVTESLDREWETLSAAAAEWPNAVRAVNAVAPFSVQERAPTRIGNRMGRPEKSESRDLSPAVHTLFPIGDAGGSQRDVADAARYAPDMSDTPGEIPVRVGDRVCPSCDEHTYESRCPDCGDWTDPHYECRDCGAVATPDESGRVECPNCGRDLDNVTTQVIDINDEYHGALRAVGERENAFDQLKGVKGLLSAEKTPEPMAKGVLRAKHDVTAFKDGTVRYDMTDLPVTAVTPAELDVTAGQFRELGYDQDIHGDPLEHDDQLVELRVQDVVLSDGAADHMLKTADFVDDLLTQYYGLDAFYDLDDRDDLVGELVFGMAPHTSAAVVGRVAGFTSASVGYAHPYFHAAKRRNCFHPETSVWFQDECGEWHHDPIETLVEARLDPDTADEDDFGALVQALDGDVFVPSVTEDGEETLQRVEAVSKHPAPDHLLAVETKRGRELTVTPDHSMRRWTGDGIERVDARELTAGDALPAPTQVPGDGETATSDPRSEFLDGTHPQRRFGDGGSVWTDEVVSVEPVRSSVDHTYSLTVAETNTLVANGLFTGQCDGDEDCVMLLMDGLINFSKSYLPDKRGGRMDAPLVMSSRIDPAEIDDEAHNIDIDREYPREFYEATRELADPEDVADLITLAESTVGTDEEYTGFGHTHATSNIHLGPSLSAYKTLGSMMDKMDAQLELARKLRSVAETDVAERVIEYHFLPDLIGNLRAFSRQETRCLDCGEKYRRMPLSGDCRECGGRVNLTVHEGSVNKYMDTAMRVATEYDCREYTKQRLEIMDRRLESVFEDDTNKQSGISDFM
ncbi:DNA-directed DNA polymerase II large subunit [Halobacterium salinarum]|uniref:DNA-directed DNA polymerase II large subunit n=1 Tax=Halobacterium salinarum TaxID=2242 RepID=UPI0025532D92|nr:DNA-directed DNA polymerase II large subunit [Halobacterium salinarum]MDL0135462.1 DNA-directed DNA polymerase II large subunit [Halobacterium salinarum]